MTIEQLYLRENERVDGPYDLMAVIRKIRNGALRDDTLVSFYPDEEPVYANTIPELLALIEEEKPAEASGGASLSAPSRPAAGGARPSRSFSQLLLGVGLEFLRNSVNAAIYSGVFMVIWLTLGFTLIYQGSILSAAIGIMLCYFLMGGYLYGVLRYVRGNPVSAGEVIGHMKQTAAHMLVLSVILGALMLPGLALVHVLDNDMLVFTLPILFVYLFIVMTLLAFAPLLVVERNADFWDAISASVRIVRTRNNIGIVFGLIALNFILLFLMPIVLPMTMGALVELYDEFFTYG